ncbi:MAG TPA: aldo/keto reductase [Polyangiaceae bacterium]|nr:aldo/keto reductase [Polyangiaceae bacterium]
MLTQSVQGVAFPAFMYGTAWKEARTAELVALALTSGFRAIDTANQRRHYVEAGVGEAVSASGLRREELFLQTKFTHLAGQDQRLPYDASAAPAEQVCQSFESSLEHLKTTYVDSYVLHGPSSRSGLTAGDRQVWRAMEELQQAGKTRLVGVSNVSLAQLEMLHADARVKPAFVQNRCYASMGWDAGVRAFCKKHGIVYQGFSLLTANGDVLKSVLVATIARRVQRTAEQVVFRFAHQLGMLPLTGTSSARHMTEDLAALDVELEDEEMSALETIATQHL